MVGHSRRIFLYGYYGRKNTGDDAMLYAFLTIATGLRPDLEFEVLRGDDVPEVPETARASTTFIPSSFTAVVKGLLRADVFAVVGGTHLTSYGLNKRTIAMVTRIALLIGISRLLGKQVYLLGAGIGPLRKFVPKAVSRWICRQASAISVRDQVSYQAVRELGVAKDVTLGFDVAAGIDWTRREKSPTEEMHRLTLGVSITPVFTLYHADRKSDRKLVEKMGDALNNWMRRHPEWHLNLFVFHGLSKGTQDDDSGITKQLQAILSPSERVKTVEYESAPRAMFSSVSRCAAFVGMKYHSCLFAYLANIPLLVVPYHPKCEALAKEIGLPRLAVVSLDVVLTGGLDEFLELLTAPGTALKASMQVDLSRERAQSSLNALVEARSR